MKDDHRQLVPSWLVSLIGRAVNRYRRGQGFESRTSLTFFQAKVAYRTVMIIIHLILHSAVHIYGFHIFKTLNTCFLSIVVKKSFFLLKIRVRTPLARSTYHQKDRPPL